MPTELVQHSAFSGRSHRRKIPDSTGLLPASTFLFIPVPDGPDNGQSGVLINCTKREVIQLGCMVAQKVQSSSESAAHLMQWGPA